MKYFLITYSIFFILASVVLFIYPKEELFFILNGLHTPFGDAVFPYLTHLGGGIGTVFIFVAFLFVSYRWALIAAVSFLVTGFVTMILKLFVFETWLRPSKYFEGSDLLHTVIGVDMHHYNSFPSGHSSTVFGLFFFLALLLKGKQQVWGILFFAIALLVGYSRIYLAQHFPEDVFSGSVLGVLLTYICYKVVSNLIKDKKWATRALFKKSKANE